MTSRMMLIRLLVLMLPSRERRIMREAWAADLKHAHELGITPASVLMGAALFVVRRAPALWLRRTWVRALVSVAATLFTVVMLPWWVLAPAFLAVGVLWLAVSSVVVRSQDA